MIRFPKEIVSISSLRREQRRSNLRVPGKQIDQDRFVDYSPSRGDSLATICCYDQIANLPHLSLRGRVTTVAISEFLVNGWIESTVLVYDLLAKTISRVSPST